MPVYKVKWELEVDADTPFEAAQFARESQLDEASEALAFDVADLANDGDDELIELIYDEKSRQYVEHKEQ